MNLLLAFVICGLVAYMILGCQNTVWKAWGVFGATLLSFLILVGAVYNFSRIDRTNYDPTGVVVSRPDFNLIQEKKERRGIEGGSKSGITAGSVLDSVEHT